MNYALILAGGTGQRMRTSGMPKQFLMVYGKPIIIYTVEKFAKCDDIDSIVIACNPQYIDHMNDLLKKYPIPKLVGVISGGKDRQRSVQNGIDYIKQNNGQPEDIVVIHDGVRPLIEVETINENIRKAKEFGCAMTARPVVESVIITDKESATFEDFKRRDNTLSLTAPQTFKLDILSKVYDGLENVDAPMPLLDTALAYTYKGNEIPIVKEYNQNIKITTPEDYYILKALVELEENKNVFGLI